MCVGFSNEFLSGKTFIDLKHVHEQQQSLFYQEIYAHMH
jgi:hypothetical protein